MTYNKFFMTFIFYPNRGCSSIFYDKSISMGYIKHYTILNKTYMIHTYYQFTKEDFINLFILIFLLCQKVFLNCIAFVTNLLLMHFKSLFAVYFVKLNDVLVLTGSKIRYASSFKRSLMRNHINA